jgi:hypothetical protein
MPHAHHLFFFFFFFFFYFFFFFFFLLFFSVLSTLSMVCNLGALWIATLCSIKGPRLGLLGQEQGAVFHAVKQMRRWNDHAMRLHHLGTMFFFYCAAALGWLKWGFPAAATMTALCLGGLAVARWAHREIARSFRVGGDLERNLGFDELEAEVNRAKKSLKMLPTGAKPKSAAPAPVPATAAAGAASAAAAAASKQASSSPPSATANAGRAGGGAAFTAVAIRETSVREASDTPYGSGGGGGGGGGLLLGTIATCQLGDGRRSPKYCEIDRSTGTLRLHETRGSRVLHELPMASYTLRLPRTRSPGGGAPILVLLPVQAGGGGDKAAAAAAARCKLLHITPNDAKNEWGDWESALRTVCSNTVFAD